MRAVQSEAVRSLVESRGMAGIGPHLCRKRDLGPTSYSKKTHEIFTADPDKSLLGSSNHFANVASPDPEELKESRHLPTARLAHGRWCLCSLLHGTTRAPWPCPRSARMPVLSPGAFADGPWSFQHSLRLAPLRVRSRRVSGPPAVSSSLLPVWRWRPRSLPRAAGSRGRRCRSRISSPQARQSPPRSPVPASSSS